MRWVRSVVSVAAGCGVVGFLYFVLGRYVASLLVSIYDLAASGRLGERAVEVVFVTGWAAVAVIFVFGGCVAAWVAGRAGRWHGLAVGLTFNVAGLIVSVGMYPLGEALSYAAMEWRAWILPLIAPFAGGLLGEWMSNRLARRRPVVASDAPTGG